MRKLLIEKNVPGYCSAGDNRAKTKATCSTSSRLCRLIFFLPFGVSSIFFFLHYSYLMCDHLQKPTAINGSSNIAKCYLPIDTLNFHTIRNESTLTPSTTDTPECTISPDHRVTSKGGRWLSCSTKVFVSQNRCRHSAPISGA